MLRAAHGDLAGTVAEMARPDMMMAGWWGAVPSRELLVHILRGDAEDGVRYRMMEVTASRRFTVMECELISPPWDPTHCPPSALWLVGMHDEHITNIRLHHPAAV